MQGFLCIHGKCLIWRGVLSDVTNIDVGPGVSVCTWQMLDLERSTL